MCEQRRTNHQDDNWRNRRALLPQLSQVSNIFVVASILVGGRRGLFNTRWQGWYLFVTLKDEDFRQIGRASIAVTDDLISKKGRRVACPASHEAGFAAFETLTPRVGEHGFERETARGVRQAGSAAVALFASGSPGRVPSRESPLPDIGVLLRFLGAIAPYGAPVELSDPATAHKGSAAWPAAAALWRTSARSRVGLFPARSIGSGRQTLASLVQPFHGNCTRATLQTDSIRSLTARASQSR
jgi:hypothetical protein